MRNRRLREVLCEVVVGTERVAEWVRADHSGPAPYTAEPIQQYIVDVAPSLHDENDTTWKESQ